MSRISSQLTPSGKWAAGAGLASFLSALAVSHPGPLMVFCVLSASFAVSLLSRRTPRRLEVQSLAPGRMIEGSGRSMDLVFTHPPGRIPACQIRTRDGEFQMRGLLAGHSNGLAVRSAVWVRGLRRGHARQASYTLDTRAPLGLLAHRLEGTLRADLLILPRARNLRESVLERLLALRPRGFDRPQPEGPGDGEFYALKEWREGETERRLHHKASARRGKKVLQEFRGEAPPVIHVVVDLRVPGSAGRFGRSDLDEALRFAAGIVRSMLRRSVPVSLFLMTEAAVTESCRAGGRDLFQYLAVLAAARPAGFAQEAKAVPRLPEFDQGGRGVLVHLGSVEEATVPSPWIAVRVGSRRYYGLLESRYGAPNRV